MPKTITKPARSKLKQITVTTSQLPEIYNNLLAEYVAILQTESTNPYEFSLQKKFNDYINIKGQRDYATSPYITNFLKIPDALEQELPRAKDMLKKLDKFDNDVLRTLAKLNSMNLARLHSRSLKAQKEQRVSAIAIIGSILGLLLDFQGLVAISIKETIIGLGEFSISLIAVLLITLIIAFAIRILIRSANRMITTPRIGLVDAFGDILNIAMVYRNVKE